MHTSFVSSRKAGWLALVSALVVFAAGATPPVIGDKHAAHLEMIALAAQINALKANPAQSGHVADLRARYAALSEAMGGDDPGWLGLQTGGTAGAAPPAPRGKGTPVPPNCGSVTDVFISTDVPIAIPTGPAVVSSTVAVSGLGPYLFDVNLEATLAHSFSADLDITLTSPAGTVVTLTTDNGAGNDDVFNGTAWDDNANPAGAVPYVTNDGIVTDHAYVNVTLASPLVPEEAMAAFVGEDPNGTWTLTVSDDLAGDSGSINAWSLGIVALDSVPTVTTTTYTSTDVPVAIPTGPAVVSSTLAVPDGGFICGVDTETFLPHTFAADLDATLTSPAGTVVTLTTDNGAGNDNVFNGTTWDDDANPAGTVPYVTNDGLVTDHAYVNATLASPLVPEEAMGTFIGEEASGTWTLTVSDDLAGDGGSIDNWSLDIDTCTCGLQEADLQVSKTGLLAGNQITWTVTVANNGPADATGVVVTDTLAACTTYVSDDCGGSNVPPWTWNVGAVANGGSASCNIIVDASGCPPGVVDNTATGTGNEDDPVPGNDSGSAQVVIPTPALVADLQVTKSSAVAGAQITWTVTVANNGPDNATGVVVTDPLAACSTHLSNNCGATNVPPLTWNVGNLANGASASCAIVVDATACGAGSIANVATAAGNETDPAAGNNIATAAATIVVGGGGPPVPVHAFDRFGLLLLLLAFATATLLMHRRDF